MIDHKFIKLKKFLEDHFKFTNFKIQQNEDRFRKVILESESDTIKGILEYAKYLEQGESHD